ncbi:MAG: hypothetical protein GYB66_16865, partial [Chloroflexi bacterium]|nr:hypothetical protein [Chloroflexota bacterium]
MHRSIGMVLALILGLAIWFPPLPPGYAQEGPTPIEAPEVYTLDLVGFSQTEETQFQVTFSLEGTGPDNNNASIELANTVALRPEPAAFYGKTEATGHLAIFDLVPDDAVQRSITNEMAYLRSGLYIHADLAAEDRDACGMSILGATPAANQLDAHVPLPAETFLAFPEIPRALPDVSFGDQVAARYTLSGFSNSSIEDGSAEIHYLPDEGRLVYFHFEGQGDFVAGETTVKGSLSYTFQMIPDQPPYAFEVPLACQNPNVQGVPIFTPSAEWQVQQNNGYFRTNRSIDYLTQFYEEQLSA